TTEGAAGQLRRDPADARDISPAHLATGGGKRERLLLYQRQANSARQYGLDESLPTESGKHDIRRRHPPAATLHHGTPHHAFDLPTVSRPLVPRQDRQSLVAEPTDIQTVAGA